jgi:hypothetical protein
VANIGKNFASRAGIFLNRNIIPIARTGLGAFAGGVLTGGNPLGMLGGGIGGATFNAWGRKALNGTINAGVSISNQVSRGGLNLVGPKKRIWLLLLLGIFGISLLTAFTGAGTPGVGTGGNIGIGSTAPGGSGSSIASCRFTRSGTAYDIKSPILEGWIVQAANNAGISPAVMASVAMHESASFVANADDNHDAIKTNHYCVKANIFCELRGQVLHSRSGQDDPCTPAEIANGAKNAQAVGLMQHLDIYNPGRDLCSITESLAIAAGKLKIDGVTNQPTQTEINTAIRRYYNGCVYGRYSYCDEVWADVQNCQTSTTPTSTVASCPLDGRRTIGCGSLGSEPRFNRNKCAGPRPEDRGHCGNTYNSPTFQCSSSSRRAHSIDVDATVGEQVKLPFINGKSSTWFNNLSARYGPLSTQDGGGYGHVFTTEADGSVWMVHFVHMAEAVIPPPLGRGYQSNDPVVTVASTSFPHLHVNIGKDITDMNGGSDWKDPESLGMCVN